VNFREFQFAHPAGESPEYDEMLACSRCALCQSVCPSYAALKLETCSPRGRVQLIRALDEGRVEETPSLKFSLSSCLDCRACESICPNGIHPGQMSVSARARFQKSISVRIRDFLSGAVFSSPALQETGAKGIAIFYQRIGVQYLLRKSGLLHTIPALEKLDRYLPPLPLRSLHQSIPDAVPAKGKKRGSLIYFAGCAMNTLFVDQAMATVESLSLLGYDVHIPHNVVCCGAPQMTMGDFDTARHMAHKNIQALQGSDLIVTDCAACGCELKGYSKLLGNDTEPFSSRIRDVSEIFAQDLPEIETTRIPDKFTWHAPCHLIHGQGVCKSPQKILRQICESYIPLNEEDRCCGSAGIYWQTHPEISEEILFRKLENIRNSGAEIIVTANPGCHLQLIAGKTENDQWDVRHISQIVLESLKISGL
jgi:glycolate oxidase iron-sulfur subunit